MAVVFWGLTIMRRLIQYFSGAEVSPIYYSTLIGGTAGILLAAIAIRHFYATVITEERIKGVTLIGNIAEIAWKDITQVKSRNIFGLECKIFEPNKGSSIWVLQRLDKQTEFNQFLERKGLI